MPKHWGSWMEAAPCIETVSGVFNAPWQGRIETYGAPVRLRPITVVNDVIEEIPSYETVPL